MAGVKQDLRPTVPVLTICQFVFLRFLAAQQAADGVGDGGVGANISNISNISDLTSSA